MRYALPLLLLACPAAAAQAPDVKKAEAAVRAYVLENADDPKSVEWVKWGPHDPKGAVAKAAMLPLLEGAEPSHLNLNHRQVIDRLDRLAGKQRRAGRGVSDYALVRVRYRLRNRAGAIELHDDIFVVGAGGAAVVGLNPHGDEWVETFARGAGR